MTEIYREPYQILLYCYHLTDDHQVKWLLLKRTPERGGFWQGVTGAALKDESLVDAARREMLEETGIELETIIETGIEYNITIRPEWAAKYNFHPELKFITEYVFVARLAHNAAVEISQEHTEWGWYGLDHAVSMLKWPKNIDALRKCQKLI